ncbi:MAG TPA: DUF488 family protein [Methylomirabilota bacterium]|nr:DUF488 family protein [Methylomirabilota bacterium]
MARLRLPPPRKGSAGKAGARTRTISRSPRRSPRIATKRVYDASAAGDGTRVLVMRYWPRGIRRDRVDVWLRELGPVIPLLRAILDGEITWAQYVPRYVAGLERPEAQAALAELRRLARAGPVTLLCGCQDPRQCHRTLLQRHLLDSRSAS